MPGNFEKQFGNLPVPSFEKPEENNGEETKLLEFSKDEEILAQKGRNALEKKAAEAEKIMAEEKEATPAEKAKAIMDYLEKSFIKKEVIEPAFFREEKEAASKFFLDFTPDKLEAHLGKEDSDLIFRVISERDRLLRKMEEDDLAEEEIREFARQNGYAMLPRRVHGALKELNFASADLESLFLQNLRFSRLSSWEEERKHLVGRLKASLVGLRRENDWWQKYANFEREKEEKPMKIQGFEKLDNPAGSIYNGAELLRIAVEMLPRGIYSANIKSIKYDGKTEFLSEADYGFVAKSAASFVPDNQYKKGGIVFHKVSDYSIDSHVFWGDIPYVLRHEWGHSLDPRLVDQKDLSPREQFKMIKDWEEARAKEEEWSSYVKKINNSNKLREESTKSQESFAESIASFLNNPFAFKELHPKRHEFVTALLERRFPGFDLNDLGAKKLLYHIAAAGSPEDNEGAAEAINKIIRKSEK